MIARNLLAGRGLGATMHALEPRRLLAVQPFQALPVNSAVDVNGTLYFSGDGSLWKSDGTDAGTVRVKELGVGIGGLTNVNGTVYFIANGDLWKSNGTAAGTVLVRETPGVRLDDEGYPYGYEITSVASVNGEALYTIYSEDIGSATNSLNRAGDTTPLTVAPDISWLTPAGRTLYFVSDSAGLSLMKSDGTAAGTVEALKLSAGGSGTEAGPLIDASGTLFYWLRFGMTEALWKTDGTAAGTARVKVINDHDRDVVGDGEAANGILFFAADDGSGIGTELWKSDGTADGTIRVKDINPGPAGSAPQNLINVNGTIYFSADDGTSGRELWRSDGTEAGTVRVADLNPLGGSSSPYSLTNVNGTLFFGTVEEDEAEFFKLDTVLRIDGTAARDVIVATVNGANIEVRNNGQVVKSAPVSETTLLTVNAGDGDDVIDCSTLAIPVVVSGGNGNDKIAGGSAPDTIGGGAGKDTIDGGLGNDRLNGHGGHDRLFGNAGGDRLYGYDGNDLLDGGSSGDRLYGGNGADTMFGASGNDRFFAAGDNAIDELFGASGDDAAVVDASDVLASIESST